MKAEGKANDLLQRLRGEAMFAEIDLDAVLNPMAYVGRAPEQVDRFLADIVEPIRREYADALGDAGELSV